jgi:hypothetical protein
MAIKLIRTAKTGTKAQADMAKTELEAVSMAEFGADLARRRAEYEERYGPLEIPRNSGKRRMPSKRALLKAIEEAGGRW